MNEEDFGKAQGLFEEKALAGNGAFAIAFAILELAQAQIEVAKALSDLGYGDGEGSLEAIRREMARIADAFVSHWGE